LAVSNRLDDLAQRFFSTVGLVEPTGYQVTEVLLDDGVKQHFGGRDYLRFTSSVEVAREDGQVEVLAYGSALLESLTEAALAQGYAGQFYLRGLNLTTGRTLEKVRRQTRIPGRIVEAGPEEAFLHHHSAFRFKVALVADSREESFDDVVVDLHSGWATTKLEKAALHLYGSQEPEVFPETPVVSTLGEACSRALEVRQGAIASRVQAKQMSLHTAASEEKGLTINHYQTIIQRLEAGKGRKGANVERIDDKIRGTLLDQDRRLEDLERKYRLGVEVTLVQLAIVSYPKVVVPLLLQQGKDQRPGMAVWDPLIHEGYFYHLVPVGAAARREARP
jgi:hypothetical protein